MSTGILKALTTARKFLEITTQRFHSSALQRCQSFRNRDSRKIPQKRTVRPIRSMLRIATRASRCENVREHSMLSHTYLHDVSPVTFSSHLRPNRAMEFGRACFHVYRRAHGAATVSCSLVKIRITLTRARTHISGTRWKNITRHSAKYCTFKCEPRDVGLRAGFHFL